MPKRIVDGEALWLSNKLLLVPERYRAEYANWIPLALANGVFEADPRKIWARVYAYNRPDVSLQHVEKMLVCYEQAKMLFLWKDATGTTWGFWIGIDKPGRLPSGTDRKNAAKGPEVPREALDSFLGSKTEAQPVDNRSSTGQGPDKTSRPPDEAIPGFERFWERYPRKEAKEAAQKAWRKLKGVDLATILSGLERATRTEQWQRGVIPHPATWLNGKRWKDEAPVTAETLTAPVAHEIPLLEAD